jgi:hypothetical protein
MSDCSDERKVVDLRVLKALGCEKAPEILIYFWIESLGNFIYAIHRARTRPSGGEPELFSDGVQRDIDNARLDQETLIDILKTREGFAFTDHAEYLKWYRWWNQWHKCELSEEKWRELNRLLRWDGTQTEETFAAWRPEGDWRKI